MWSFIRWAAALAFAGVVARQVRAVDLSAAAGETTTNAPTVTVGEQEIDVKKADDCLKHLHDLLDKLTQLHEQATTNQDYAGRLECIRIHLIRLRGVVEVASQSYAQMSEAVSVSDA